MQALLLYAEFYDP